MMAGTQLALYRPGSKIEFISKHIELPNAVIIEKAKEKGIELSAAMIDASKWTIRKKLKETKKKRGPYKVKAKLAKLTNKDIPTGEDLKLAQLRKLVFEIGYDKFRAVFHEFEEMYKRWS